MTIKIKRGVIGEILTSPGALALVDDLAQQAIDGMSDQVQLVAERDERQRRRAGLEMHPDRRQDAYKVAKHPDLLMQALAHARG